MPKQINALGTEKTAPDATDLFPLQEAGGTTRRIKYSNLGISGARSSLLNGLECWLDMAALTGARYDLHKQNHLFAVGSPSRQTVGSRYVTRVSSGNTLAAENANRFLSANRSFTGYIRLKFNALPGVGARNFIIAKGDVSSVFDYFLYLRNDAGTLRLLLAYGNGSNTFLGENAINNAFNTVDWHTIFFWHDAENAQWNLQLNNTSLQFARAGNLGSSSSTMRIGALSNASESASLDFSHFCWWNRLLTPTERTTIITNGPNQDYPT